MTPWQSLLFRFINFWPPFLGAGIRLKRLSPDCSEAHVELKMRWWNKNYVGVHFGGSLYAMTDPFYMLIAMERFRQKGWLKEYVIWDKAATVRFRRPGTGTVRAHFKLTDDQILELKAQADLKGKHDAVYVVKVVDEQGLVVAEVDKTLYIKKNPRN